jgi:hypothetical protein
VISSYLYKAIRFENLMLNLVDISVGWLRSLKFKRENAENALENGKTGGKWQRMYRKTC